MRPRNCGWALLISILLLPGCATYRAYNGEQRPRGEVATIDVPLTNRLIVDRRLADATHVSEIEVLPGEHTVEWKYVYPNHYSEMKRITFTAEAGKRYRLGQRFLPAPYDGNALELAFDVAIDTTVMPFMMIFPPEPPKAAPAGKYYMWVTDARTEQVLAGTAPAVSPGANAITHAPASEADGDGAGADRLASSEPHVAP